MAMFVACSNLVHSDFTETITVICIRGCFSFSHAVKAQ